MNENLSTCYSDAQIGELLGTLSGSIRHRWKMLFRLYRCLARMLNTYSKPFYSDVVFDSLFCFLPELEKDWYTFLVEQRSHGIKSRIKPLKFKTKGENDE